MTKEIFLHLSEFLLITIIFIKIYSNYNREIFLYFLSYIISKRIFYYNNIYKFIIFITFFRTYFYKIFIDFRFYFNFKCI